jgi:predicted metal-dependent hydrolase
MSINSHHLQVGTLEVEVVRKAIKNLHLGVYPPLGYVRIAAPEGFTDDAVRMAVISRMSWIKKHQRRYKAQLRQTRREYVSGESHYLWGKRYLLKVVKKGQVPKLTFKSIHTIIYQVPAEYTLEQRERSFQAWYRRELKAAATPLVEKWARLLNVSPPDIGIKYMKTKWGSFSPMTRRIWLNLELAKKPPRCLEYIVVHEMMHLHERHHNERFVKLMNQHFPQWKNLKTELNQQPLKHETWKIGTRISS